MGDGQWRTRHGENVFSRTETKCLGNADWKPYDTEEKV